MRDLNYFPLDVEGNIYGMTTLEFDDKTTKVLVATLDCRIYCINYCNFKPHTKEVEFTYIPNGAKIVSIGSLKRGPNDFVIGITHSLAPNLQKGSNRISSSCSGGDHARLTSYYFNIYASGSMLPNFDLDYVAQGCQTIRLRYVPYHLYQTELTSLLDSVSIDVKRKPYWLLSGGDNCIHAFCEDKPNQSFIEIPLEDCFAELTNIGGLTLWIDIMNIDDCSSHERLVALGLEDGSVKFFHSILSKDTLKFELIRKSSFDDYATIIPSVRFFKISSTCSSKFRRFAKSRNLLNETQQEHFRHINLLAVSSTQNSIVFEDVSNMGLDSRTELIESQRLDCAVTCAVGDINLDGQNELLIGTHGRELMTYQYDNETKGYFLDRIDEMNHPIYAVSILDLTGDALKDVTLLLASGILVLQASVRDVIDICRRRVEILMASLTKSQ